MKISKTLIISFIFTILLSMAAIFIISNTMINNNFEKYLKSEREQRFSSIYDEINRVFAENNALDNRMLMYYSMNENINITIEDIDGNVIYEINSNSGMGMGMHRRMHNRSIVSQGNYTEIEYDLTEGNSKIGSMIIGYIDNSYLTDSAILFKNTLTTSLIISGIVALILGIGISIMISNRFAAPLMAINKTAENMRKGNLLPDSTVESNITEISQLSSTIKYLGETLAKQENIRKRYASDISHELRTPLTTLKTHLEALTDGIWEPTEEHLSILINEVDSLSHLVDDLKNSFIQEEYILPLNITSFSLSEELMSIIEVYNPLFDSHNYLLTSSIEKNLEILSDRDKIRQIINNLLSNSLRYLNEDGRVSVELNKAGERQINLTITDNGIGIEEKDLPHIFDRFYRADASRDKSTGGTGLGLSIVKSMVQSLEGSIEINSEYGKGTKVQILLPYK